MYKHGVAFVERGGPVDGDFDLLFRRDDMKDVLKSLSVDAGGAGVSVDAVAFDIPSEPRDELESRNLLFESGEALLGLLDGLRGRAVDVRRGGQQHRGEVIGVDDVGGNGQTRRLLVLRAETGAVTLVDLMDVDRIEVLEEPSRDDLDYLIDRSRAATAGENRSVTIRLRGRADDARVSYTVPAPVWRVSYRAIREGDTMVLAAMGIVHNPLDEDLADVALTLTTGQPISFDIDLYHGKHVQRTVVEEAERMAGPPVEGRTAFDRFPPRATMSAGAYEEAAEDVETGARGEHFEYRLSTPVSLKRGGAAMVPLAVERVDAVRRELVWRPERETAPYVVLAFTNTTGVVLEEGPAVVYDEGGYAGEAMLPFTSRGADVRLSFAKDLAVHCGHAAIPSTVTAGVRLGRDAAVEERRVEELHVLRAENDYDDPVDVVFELPGRSGHTFTPQDGVAEAAQDGAVHRFRVQVPAHGVVEATVLESWPSYRHIEYDELSAGRLERWLDGRFLDEATIGILSDVLARWQAAARLDTEREELQAERDDVYAAQSRIAEQLRVLASDGQEGELRSRHVRELERLTDQVHGLDTEIGRRRDDADVARREASAELQRITAAS
jgi:hypothetical protein